MTHSEESERLAKAAAAGRLAAAAASPYEKQAKTSGTYKLWYLAVFIFDVSIIVWLARHGAPWWMTWCFAGVVAVGALSTLAFYPLANRIKRRKMLLAREQVHQVRKLASMTPVQMGLGLLFDADPLLDKDSVEVGSRFAMSAVIGALDEVQARTPEPSWLGYTIDDDGKATKR